MGLGNHLFHARKKKGLSLDELESMLVLKDILASVWKGREKNGIEKKHDACR
ncbi:MAG: hypothetical protein HFG41_09895 [Coprococcus sp.]|nr:hypothetical protein [Coprococcus sp.]